MTIAPPDGSRDRRIEDPTNLWLIHPAARVLLPIALRAHVSANAVSLCGLALGIGAAIAYSHWDDPRAVLLGLLLTVGWLIADGLDGMIARATGTASAVGRLLDGLCDHGVFILIYLVLAFSIGTLEGWLLAVTAGIMHIVQSSLFESERARFHRRVKGDAGDIPPARTGSILERLYDDIASGIDRRARRFDNLLRSAPDSSRLGTDYGRRATPAMKVMALESANMRVWAIFIACLLGNPRLFWWFEIVPLTLLLIVTLLWHRRVESMFLHPDGHAAVST